MWIFLETASYNLFLKILLWTPLVIRNIYPAFENGAIKQVKCIFVELVCCCFSETQIDMYWICIISGVCRNMKNQHQHRYLQYHFNKAGTFLFATVADFQQWCSNIKLAALTEALASAVSRLLSPSNNCSDLRGVSAGLRLLAEFPSRSGSDEDTDTADWFLLHFNTEGYSSTAGNSSVAGNSSCSAEWGERHQKNGASVTLNTFTHGKRKGHSSKPRGSQWSVLQDLLLWALVASSGNKKEMPHRLFWVAQCEQAATSLNTPGLS